MTFSYDHNQSLGYLTALTSRLLSNMLTSRFQNADIDMTAEQWGAILVLMNDKALTQAQIGERLHLEKSSVSRLINRLERRGWLIRTNDMTDGRQKIVEPTAKARGTVEHCADIARTILEEAQLGLTEEERLLVKTLLLRIIGNLRVIAK
ncbi:MAG: MarR family winged helix-turn-helix transcriptional regulator [Desulfopila sp.]